MKLFGLWPSRRCAASRSDWDRPSVRCQRAPKHRGMHRYEDDEFICVWHTGAWHARYQDKETERA